jgi:cbb3-type cytochrome oxidase maturation protein
VNILFLMIPVSLGLAGLFLAGFIWGVASGQMDDTDTPAHRILED